VSFTHYLLCACGNISWYPWIRSLCESHSWCKHFGGGNSFFLCLDQTTIPCSLCLWPADHTAFTGLTHLMRSINHKLLHVIIYNKPTRCNSGSIVFINNYKYALHVSDALCVHHQSCQSCILLVYYIYYRLVMHGNSNIKFFM
jgi:hypothetical protein